MRHVAIYSRISRDKSGLGVGVKLHEKLCREYAQRQWPDLPVVAYVDNDITGTNTERERYQDLLAAVRAGDVAQVVVKEQSRLTRETDEFKRLGVALYSAGIDRLHCVDGGTVSVVPGDAAFGKIKAVFDEEEVERAKVRIRAKLDSNAKEGRPTGRAPYGYRRTVDEDGRPALEVDPATAAVVRRIADRLEAGDSFAAICRGLAADEVPTPRGGKKWHPSSLRSVITKPSVAGLRVHQGEIVGEARWEPIIDPDRWRRLVESIAGERWTVTNGKRRRVTRKRRTALRRLLTGGLAVCGECGTPLVATTQSTRKHGRLPAYGCHPNGQPEVSDVKPCGGVSIRADLLDDLVTDAVFVLLASNGRIAAALNPSPTDGLEAVANELRDVERLLADLGTDYASGAIDRTAFMAAQDTARARADALRELIESARRPSVDEDPLTLPERWESLPMQRKRAVMEAIINVVTIGKARGGPRFDPDRVDIEWKA